MNRENGSEHLKLIAGDKHLVHLSVARISIANKALVVRWIEIGCYEEGLVKELLVGKRERVGESRE